MKKSSQKPMCSTLVILTLFMVAVLSGQANKKVGVGTKAPQNAEVLFDGSRALLNKKWTYWEGPRLAAELPLKWSIEKDPVDKGTVVNSNDPSATGGKYGAADMVTKTKFSDFRLHIEFLVVKEGGNSGVYL